jgi:hypothetical protein
MSRENTSPYTHAHAYAYARTHAHAHAHARAYISIYHRDMCDKCDNPCGSKG